MFSALKIINTRPWSSNRLIFFPFTPHPHCYLRLPANFGLISREYLFSYFRFRNYSLAILINNPQSLFALPTNTATMKFTQAIAPVAFAAVAAATEAYPTMAYPTTTEAYPTEAYPTVSFYRLRVFTMASHQNHEN